MAVNHHIGGNTAALSIASHAERGGSSLKELEIQLQAEDPSEQVFSETKQVSFQREEVVSLAKEDLNFLASLLMPLQFILFFPALHKVVWKLLLDCVHNSSKKDPSPKEKFPQIAIGWPRGHLKTTLVKIFVCWCILFSTKKFIMIVAANAAKAENILADIFDMLSEPNILSIFGDWKVHIEADRTNLKKFSFMGRDVIIAALGSGGDPRGLNIKNERPDVIVMDDMQSKENAESPTQSKSLLSWMTATLAKSKSPHGCIFIYIGNMFSAPGTILKILKNNPNWTSVIVAGILSDGSALWPELRSKEDLMEEFKNDIAMGTPEAFLAEIMNDPTAGITSTFDVSKVPESPFIKEENIVGASFIIIDAASGRDTKRIDNTTIMHYSVYDGTPVADELIDENLDPGATIRKALIMALKTQCPCIGVETVAYQSTLLYWFDQVCKQHGIEGIHFVELHPKGRTKISRILAMFKTLIGTVNVETGKVEGRPSLYLEESLKNKVFWEISQFKPDRRDNVDNILDNLAYAQDMLQDYGDLIWHPLSAESALFGSAQVVEFNSPF